ncbi:hypothetical protein [Kineosporia babensis]|uniref:Uncharacterized protein n=1 Tax=Kineosporia babensis TaxID=499548 RepID=A0A9X1SXT8_9ACTN|nr:hypothetical protein [Kineosporia babensis]MCD5316316.1 hypothetical protein [Kineosporia babensis]
MEINPPRPRGRHLARRSRTAEVEASTVSWQQSEVVKAHTGSIPVVQEEASRLDKLRAIRDRMAEPDPA